MTLGGVCLNGDVAQPSPKATAGRVIWNYFSILRGGDGLCR